MAKGKKQIKKAKKGFTIIEVVLVLAIAGLIFLMVFIALPALQRAQRNTQRSDDLSRILTAINAFQSNNSGRLPFTTAATPTAVAAPNGMVATFINRYIDDRCSNNIGLGTADPTCGDQFTDPDGNVYMFRAIPTPGAVANADGSFPLAFPVFGTGATQAQHTIYVAVHANCGAMESTVRNGTGPRQVAVYMVLEGNAVTCNDNQ